MQEASISGVLKVLLIVLLIYFGLKLIIRWFGPILLRYILKKVGKKFGQDFSQFGQQGKRRGRGRDQEGEVTIEKKPKNTRRSKKDVGEYIDYEEID